MDEEASMAFGAGQHGVKMDGVSVVGKRTEIR